MPKVNLGANLRSSAPPIDWLWAAILERKVAYGYDLRQMADVAGVSYEYMRRIINKPPREWPYGALTNICRKFGISLVPSVDGSTPEEVFKV